MNDQQWREWNRAEDWLFSAWYAAVISGVGSVLLSLWASQAGPADDPGRWFIPGDAVLTLLLGWLTKRHRSEAAAFLLFLRSLVFGILMFRSGSFLAGLLTLAVFSPMYLFGFLGARTLRQLMPIRAAATMAASQPNVGRWTGHTEHKDE